MRAHPLPMPRCVAIGFAFLLALLAGLTELTVPTRAAAGSIYTPDIRAVIIAQIDALRRDDAADLLDVLPAIRFTSSRAPTHRCQACLQRP